MSAGPIQIEEARRLVLAEVAALEAEPVALAAALGRVLAEPARAEADIPAFDNSAMDGYAVRSADVAEASAQRPSTLEVVDESRAGAPARTELAEGQAIAISTGAMVPTGADAVVRVEDTEPAGEGRVSIHVAASEGADLRRAGEDARKGAEVLAAGRRLGPAELGVLASVGVAEPSCAKRPRVAVLATGDELRDPADELGPGQIHNTNGFAVPALAREAGADPALVETVPDEAGGTRERLERALGSSDVVCVCGGVSVGEHDHVKGALAELGVCEVFWRVAMRPGGPMWFGVAPGGRLVFGLPGNPVSAMVTFTLFARPALLAMQQASEPLPARLSARLGAAARRAGRRTNAIRVTLSQAGDGTIVATPTGAQGSHVLTSMLGADALAFLVPGEGSAEAGEPVEVEPLAGSALGLASAP